MYVMAEYVMAENWNFFKSEHAGIVLVAPNPVYVVNKKLSNK